MPHREIKVLRVNSVEEQSAYRAAVAKIIANIQRDYELTHIDIAETIDVSVGTIANAANKRGDLTGIFIARLGKAFGASYLDPFCALFDGRAIPLEADDADALPPLSGVVHKIAEARDPRTPGGTTETHTQLAAMLPELHAAMRALTNLIIRAERLVA